MSRSEVAANALVASLVVAATYGVLWLLVRITDILVLVLISAILASGLAPTVARLERTRVGRRSLGRAWAIGLTVLGVLAAVGLMVSVLVTPLVQQAGAFFDRLPEYVREAEEWLRQLRLRYPWVPDASRWVARLPEEVQNFAQYFGPAAGVFGRFVGGLFTATTVLVLVVYMLIEGPRLKQGFVRLFPPSQRPLVVQVLDGVAGKFSGWVRGTFLMGFSIFVMDTVGLILLGMPYPFVLGLAAGVAELIPVVGPFLGAVPAVLVALFQPTWKLVGVVVLFVLAQQIEQNVLVPRIMSRAVGLSPILAIFALLAGGALMGPVGVLLSIPVAAALQVVATEVVRVVLPYTRSDAHVLEDAADPGPLAGETEAGHERSAGRT
ncbi:MAG: AI-2E family transporter [Armatimonadota bacterium]|nr:AI-2E family transporter [Armatimonadota bacterium]MDR7411523.1 AI-2E family transporter [Armatimonadota bacterium]